MLNTMKSLVTVLLKELIGCLKRQITNILTLLEDQQILKNNFRKAMEE